VALSPAHRVGQIIGYALETSVEPLLEAAATEHSLYLDTIGPRPARNGRKLLGWKDEAGNNHNLDFVLERGGTRNTVGAPVAFIEVAWRRYTKHSVNKAGEIANALVPLRQTFARTRPFTGAVVAGVWTEGGLRHMTSQGIAVLYIPLSEIVEVFGQYGIDVGVGEDTSEDYLQDQVDKWDALGSAQQKQLSLGLMEKAPERYAAFRETIDVHLRRQITRILILPLFGATLSFDSPGEALAALEAFGVIESAPKELAKIELQIRYSNGDKIDAEFANPSDASEFLQNHI
jgi:hypothetical protein